MTRVPSLAIIGGGVSGMTAAYELSLANPQPQITVYEAEGRPGGVLQTEHRDGWILDNAADNFIVFPDDALKLCEELGIADTLQTPAADDRRALIVHQGRLKPTPEGLALMRPSRFRAVLASPLLSVRAKLRLALEPFVPKRVDPRDESLADFVRRRLGPEFLQRIVQPLIAGIYTGDAEKLSVRATVPQVVAMEQKYGSLFRGTLASRREASEAATRQASGARYGQFRALPSGTNTLIQTLISKLPASTVQLNARVESIRQTDDQRWVVRCHDGRETVHDGVISAMTAPQAHPVFQANAPEIAQGLAEIPYASSAIVLLGIRQQDLTEPLQGFGFVVPQIERREILSVSYASKKYAGRAPDGMHLLRVFIGGALQPELLQKSDEQLIDLACREVQQLLGYHGTPVLREVVRWGERMPQYHVGHLERIAALRAVADKRVGLKLIGNAFDGVGIPQCVKSARREAKRLIEDLNKRLSPQAVVSNS